MSLPRISNETARAIFLDRHGLAETPQGADAASLLRQLGFVQIDSIATVERAHHMILWARRPSYRPAMLDKLHSKADVFEHWTHDASAIPIEYYPYWRLKFARDVEGIVEMMLDATSKFDEPLTDSRLFAWHAALFPAGRSGMSQIAVGMWRPEEAGDMKVVSGPLGRERVHFEAPEAKRLDIEMQAFLEWFNRPSAIDPVLKAGVAHLWFVTIHPFEDGNGRIARAIADMALARADRTTDRFYSMSSQIAADRKEYYREL
ncbi:MAG: hypothetical protein EBS68_06145, partial [Rhodobacteraceae bacterium]|nr:hypothetical protein [Paracoccaceae bacterium]